MNKSKIVILRIRVSRPLRPKRLKRRWYCIDHEWTVTIYTNVGVIVIHVAPGFLFDGRSGGPLLDCVAPNLGTTEEVWAWAVHDLLGHGIYGGFEFTNDCLYWILFNLAKYRSNRAELIYDAVSLYDDWYGEPEPGNRSYPNLALITVRHYATEEDI